MEPVTYLCKYFLDIAIDGVSHLRDYVSRLGRNLGRLSIIYVFIQATG